MNRLISLYNDVIQWLSSVASNAQLHGLSWPIIEFGSDHEGSRFHHRLLSVAEIMSNSFYEHKSFFGYFKYLAF